MKAKKDKKEFKFLKNAKKVLSQRSFKYGSASTLISVLLIAIIVFINVITLSLSEKFNLKLDLTSNKVFSLTEQSAKYLQGLEKDVKVIVLSDESSFENQGEYFVQANSVLKQYANKSKKISLEYKDVVKDPSFLQTNYPTEKLAQNSIIVRSGDKYKIISVNDLFDISYGYYGGGDVTASKAEQELTSAIIYVTSDKQKKILFLKGYAEQDYSAFSELLKKNNYDVVDVNLLTEEIPEDGSICIIFGAERDYEEKDINKVENFLNIGDKSLIYAPNPNEIENKNLSSFLEKWLVRLEKGLIYETNSKKLTSSRNIFEAVCDYVDTTYTEGLKNAEIPVLVPACKPIKILDESKVKVLLQFADTSGILPPNADKDFDIKANIKGPNPCCTLSSKNIENKSDSNLILMGSYTGLTENYLLSTSLNNSDYFINLINKLSKKEDVGITIESKSVEAKELGINASQTRIIGFVFVILLPLLILAIGIVVYVRRKNR